jgi:hypothetical protein
MQDAEREYDYNPRWTVIVLSGGFFAGCAVILAFKAANNQRGLTWGGIIELGPAGATAFYWVITACCWGFVVLAMFLAAQRLLLRKTLRLGTTGVMIPANLWSFAETEIAYQDIQSLLTNTINGQELLYVTHRSGRATIAASMFASKRAYRDFSEALAASVEQARRPASGLS